MTTNVAIFLAAFILGIVCFSFSFYFSAKAFNRTGSARFSFLRYFPFELNPFRTNNKSSYSCPFLTIFGSFSLVVSMMMFLLEVISKGGNVVIASIFVIIVFLALCCFNALSFIKLSALKLHLLFVVLFFAFVFMTNSLYALYIFNTDVRFVGNTKLAVRIVAAVIAILNIIFQLILVLNKNYKNWAVLVELDAETYSRPKISYMPVVEWGTLLSLFITFIPLGIILIF